MAFYVASDIHGYYSQFMALLKQADFNSSDKLLLLGDNIDRGRESLEMLDFIRNNPNVDSLKGNHELMMLEDISDLRQLDPAEWYFCDKDWFRNGGEAVLREMYEREAEMPGYIDDLINWVASWEEHRVFSYAGKRWIAVHAGYLPPGSYDDYCDVEVKELPHNLHNDPKAVLQANSVKTKVWVREKFYMNPGISGCITLFGHTITRKIRWKITDVSLKSLNINFICHDVKHGDKICLDCGSYRSGCLGLLRLDDMREFYHYF
jgi:hypothetical protein